MRSSGARLEPLNMRTIDRIPQGLCAFFLWAAFCTPMARRSLVSHAGAAPGEVAALHAELQMLGHSVGRRTPFLEHLKTRIPEVT